MPQPRRPSNLKLTPDGTVLADAKVLAAERAVGELKDAVARGRVPGPDTKALQRLVARFRGLATGAEVNFADVLAHQVLPGPTLRAAKRGPGRASFSPGLREIAGEAVAKQLSRQSKSAPNRTLLHQLNALIRMTPHELAEAIAGAKRKTTDVSRKSQLHALFGPALERRLKLRDVGCAAAEDEAAERVLRQLLGKRNVSLADARTSAGTTGALSSALAAGNYLTVAPGVRVMTPTPALFSWIWRRTRRPK